MSGVFGVVAEFNPFHNGHAALCDAARKNGATHIVAVMSGNFVQRGSPAITDKRVRARCALLAGANLVLELPVPYATATAQRFARGAMSILQASGVVDGIAFGSECGDAQALSQAAAAVDAPEVIAAMRAFLREGLTFARARELAVGCCYPKEIAALLSSPNNALAIEYLRQAAHIGWDAEVFTLARQGVDHDSPHASQEVASASYLRAHSRLEDVAAFVPPRALETLAGAIADGLYPCDEAKLETALLSQLRRMSVEEFAALPDVSEGLENRLYAAVRQGRSLEELYALLKTKRYTLARIRRLVLSAYLGIRRADTEAPPPYIRVLGFDAHGSALVSAMKKRCKLPASTSLARLRAHGGSCERFAGLEELATDLYGLLLPVPPACGYEYTAAGVFI